MGRIRTIKPEFPQSETIGKLSRDGRLLFIQLWTIVDDAGRVRGASRMLASLLYPYDDDAPSLMEGWLGELERERCVHRYEVGGAKYLEICNWGKHQNIEKPSISRLPDRDGVVPARKGSLPEASPKPPRKIDEASARPPQPIAKSSPTDLVPSTLDLVPSTEKDSGAVQPEEAVPPPKRGTRLKEDWKPSEAEIAYAVSKGLSKADIEREVEKFRNYWLAKPKDNTKLAWTKTWQNWVINAVSRGQTSGQRTNGGPAPYVPSARVIHGYPASFSDKTTQLRLATQWTVDKIWPPEYGKPPDQDGTWIDLDVRRQLNIGPKPPPTLRFEGANGNGVSMSFDPHHPEQVPVTDEDEPPMRTQ